MKKPSTDVFLSFASADEPIASQLAQALRGHGLSVWKDQDLQVGSDWAYEIQRAIEGSNIVLVLLSKDSAKSDWVRREAAIALATGNKRVVPVFLTTNVDLPFILRSRHGVDLSDEDSRADSIERFAHTLAKIDPPHPEEASEIFGERLKQIRLGVSALESEEKSFEYTLKRSGQNLLGVIGVVGSLAGVVAVFVAIGIVFPPVRKFLADEHANILSALAGAALGVVVGSLVRRKVSSTFEAIGAKKRSKVG